MAKIKPTDPDYVAKVVFTFSLFDNLKKKKTNLKSRQDQKYTQQKLYIPKGWQGKPHMKKSGRGEMDS